MGLFKKKVDPISERAKSLQDEIAALESKIQKLSSRVEQGAARASRAAAYSVSSAPAVQEPEPVFEEVNHALLTAPQEVEVGPEYYNELGVRKYDLTALIRRLRKHIDGKPAHNPKLVTFLAAGSIQGLRPLRYEKRVARNRFLVFSFFLLLALWGLLAMFLKQR